jgi:adenine/guanine/hypoxanthine permease
MAYIVIVNPAILSSPGTGFSFSGVSTATVLVASSMTLLMSVYARLPFAVGPGMGLHAFFTYTIVLQQQVPSQVALRREIPVALWTLAAISGGLLFVEH